MRKIIVTGNITRDAELKHVQSGDSVINFDLAINERWVVSGVKKEKVHYVRCAKWGSKTDIIKYLAKGVKLLVEGSPEVEAYLNKDNVPVAVQKITVERIEFLAPAKKPESQSVSDPQSARDNYIAPTPDDDLPF